MEQTQPADADARAAVMDRVRTKLGEVDDFLAHAGGRRRRLTNITIVGGGTSALLTAVPALGGSSFSTWLERTAGLSSPAWQILCALAAACSLAATIATQLLKAHHYEEDIVRAQGVRGSLEGLEIGLDTGTVSAADGTAKLLQTVETSAFVRRRERG